LDRKEKNHAQWNGKTSEGEGRGGSRAGAKPPGNLKSLLAIETHCCSRPDRTCRTETQRRSIWRAVAETAVCSAQVSARQVVYTSESNIKSKSACG
jgi:hypothetical protein